MMKHEKFMQRSWDYGQKFFVLQGKKSSVPLGCVFAGIRFVTGLAGMNNYLTRPVSSGLPGENSNATVT